MHDPHGPAVSIVGDIECDTDLLIACRVRGRIRLRGVTLVVAPDGQIDGDIRGTRVVVHGLVRGSIRAAERKPTGLQAVEAAVTLIACIPS